MRLRARQASSLSKDALYSIFEKGNRTASIAVI